MFSFFKRWRSGNKDKEQSTEQLSENSAVEATEGQETVADKQEDVVAQSTPKLTRDKR